MSAKARPVSFGRRITVFYCQTCQRLFGKTISVMIGEADEAGRWYGAAGEVAVSWLLRDPDHCANQLIYHRRSRRMNLPSPGRKARQAGEWTLSAD